MRLTVRARGFDLTPGLRDYATRRVHLALGRFAPRLGHVYVRLSDVNGPRGGVDKCCHLTIKLRVHGTRARELAIDDLQADLYAAIDSAMGRAAQTVARALDQAATAA